MKIFPIGTSRLHEPLGLISDYVNFPGFGYFHSPSQIKSLLMFLSGSIDLSAEQARFFFRRDQTNKNPFLSDVWDEGESRQKTFDAIKSKFQDSDILVIEVSSFKSFILDGLSVQGNPNYYHDIPYSDIWNKNYYEIYHPSLSALGSSDEENLNDFFLFLSGLADSLGKKIIMLGHLVDPSNPNSVRRNLNTKLDYYCQRSDNVSFLDTEPLVEKYGFRVLNNGNVDIHHLPWDALDELSSIVLESAKKKARSVASDSSSNLVFELKPSNLHKINEIKDIAPFLRLIINPNLVERIKSESKFEGFWAFSQVMDVLQERASQLPVSFFDCYTDRRILFNIAYIFPKIFPSTKFFSADFFRNLSFNDFTSLLTRGDYYKSLLELIESEPTKWREEYRKLLNLSFKITFESKDNREEELKMLSRVKNVLRDHTDPSTDINPKTIISQRLEGLQKLNFKRLNNDKICLLIAGQLRGYRKSLTSIVNSFTEPSNVDVFVSTWSDVGRGSISPERLSRFYDKEAFLYINKKYSGEEAVALTKELIQSVSDNVNGNEEIYFESAFEKFNSFKFNEFDDQKYPFNRMNNSEKMYFHNSFWIETLSPKYFEKYDRIIKIRPDIMLKEGVFFDKIDMLSDTVYVENYGGWIYRDWGFGIGDQIITGGASEVIQSINLHGEKRIETRFNKYLSQTPYGYSGHRNCGVAAWIHGFDCKVSEVRPLSICNLDSFTLTDVKDIEEK